VLSCYSIGIQINFSNFLKLQFFLNWIMPIFLSSYYPDRTFVIFVNFIIIKSRQKWQFLLENPKILHFISSAFQETYLLCQIIYSFLQKKRSLYLKGCTNTMKKIKLWTWRCVCEYLCIGINSRGTSFLNSISIQFNFNHRGVHFIIVVIIII
jgi:hypothetical protein